MTAFILTLLADILEKLGLIVIANLIRPKPKPDVEVLEKENEELSKENGVLATQRDNHISDVDGAIRVLSGSTETGDSK